MSTLMLASASGPKIAAATPGLSCDLAQRNLGFVLGEGDAGDDVAFHDFLLAADQRARRRAVRVDILGLVEAGADENRHVVHHAEFHRAHLQDLGAQRGQFQHVLEGDLVEPPRLRNHPRVGRIDAVDVGIDVAAVGADRGRNRHRRGVRAAAPERGDSVGLRVDALEAGDDGDFLAIRESVDDLGAVDLENPRRGVRVGGLDRDLPALPGAGLDAHALQRDREQTGRDLFAGCHHGVIFARVMHRRGVAAPVHQFVGLAGHRRHDDGDIMSGIDFALDVTRDVADSVDIGDGRAAEFHHEAAHDDACIPCEDK